jgi:hypothetical protein
MVFQTYQGIGMKMNAILVRELVILVGVIGVVLVIVV